MNGNRLARVLLESGVAPKTAIWISHLCTVPTTSKVTLRIVLVTAISWLSLAQETEVFTNHARLNKADT